MRIGINGFGRMGRLAQRAGWGEDGLEFVQVNETACDAAGSAHLLEFDSVQGRWDVHAHADADTVHVEEHPLRYTSNEAIEATDWSGCDLVVEATGRFRRLAQLEAYLAQGVDTVLVAAPVEGALNLVYGVNQHLYDPERHRVVTAASCTTNCLAPMVKVMHESVGV